MTDTVRDPEELRVVAVIQARMGSTRLPGKVLMPIAGMPLLWHVVHRLKLSRLIDEIAIATTTNPLDEAIVEFADSHGIGVVRGPEDDVLARFARAAEILDADIVVRVSSDAPFIDPGFVDHLIAAMIAQGGDYVLLENGAETAHEGVDPMSRRALDKLMMDAHGDPVAREHVTGYFKLHPDFVHIAKAPPYPSLSRKAGRLTIDTPDDLAFVEAIHARLAARAGEAQLSDLLLLLEREPSLRSINAHVRQKPLDNGGGIALVRCDGGGSYGYGHVKRMLSLARALRDRHGIGSHFLVNGSDDALQPIRRAGFDADLIDRVDEASALAGRISKDNPDILILDCRDGLSMLELKQIARPIPVTVVVDDASPRRLAANIAYYPPVPQAQHLEWHDAKTCVRVGWEWALLGLSTIAQRPRAITPRPTLLVTMGGSDPGGLTLRAAHALRSLDPAFRARFVIGPGMKNRDSVARTIVGLRRNFETIEGADDLATEYATADLALAAFGVSAFELAAFGVPTIYLGLTKDHAISASAFEHAGMGISLGAIDDISDHSIATVTRQLLADATRRRQMRTAALATIDGDGAARIAADIADCIVARRSISHAVAAG